ncbi:hypothetical protein FO519_008094 [Halicephalobus sp. NKZ332]|nr:hypothetical protein FO519_008094 [Halicephalobus sp. NKZ332]
MSVKGLAEVGTLNDLLEVLGITTDDNMEYEEWPIDEAAAKLTRDDLITQFLFSKATATKIYHALAEIRRFRKLKKPEPKKRKFFSSLFSFRNAPADSEFMNVFEALSDLQFSPQDEWPMDLCAAANSAASSTFEAIVVREGKRASEWREVRNEEGWTPLMYAVAIGRPRVIKLLLNYGASLKDTNNFGQSALMLAASFGHEGVIKLLADHARKQSEIYNNAKAPIFADELLTLNYVDNRGYTALHYASFYAQLDAMKILLDLGANPNIPDNDGMTPTLIACIDDSQEACLQYLVEHGGNLDLMNNEGKSGIDLAQNKQSIYELKFKHSNNRKTRHVFDNEVPRYGSF